MVKLPVLEQVGGEVCRRNQPRSHHNWGSRLGKSRSEAARNPEPKGLLDLEERAKIIVRLMEKHTQKSALNYDRAMDLLRLQYNMNFIVLCEKCHGPHVNDEILSPER